MGTRNTSKKKLNSRSDNDVSGRALKKKSAQEAEVKATDKIALRDMEIRPGAITVRLNERRFTNLEQNFITKFLIENPPPTLRSKKAFHRKKLPHLPWEKVCKKLRMTSNGKTSEEP